MNVSVKWRSHMDVGLRRFIINVGGRWNTDAIKNGYQVLEVEIGGGDTL